MKYRVKKLQLVILHYGCKWIWLTVAGGSGLLWNMAQGVPKRHSAKLLIGATLLYRVSHELRSLLRENVPYVKIYRYIPKHLCPKLNGYGDNGRRKVWSSCGYTHCTCQLTLINVRPCVGCHVTEFLRKVARSLELLQCSWRAEGPASDSKQSSRFVLWWLCSEQ
jgi:hypothetical protein